MINFIRICLFSKGLLCLISYSELSVIYNNKNYGSLSYILIIAVQNSRITLDRQQCIAICSKFKRTSLLLKNSISICPKQNFQLVHNLLARLRLAQGSLVAATMMFLSTIKT